MTAETSNDGGVAAPDSGKLDTATAISPTIYKNGTMLDLAKEYKLAKLFIKCWVRNGWDEEALGTMNAQDAVYEYMRAFGNKRGREAVLRTRIEFLGYQSGTHYLASLSSGQVNELGKSDLKRGTMHNLEPCDFWAHVFLGFSCTEQTDAARGVEGTEGYTPPKTWWLLRDFKPPLYEWDSLLREISHRAGIRRPANDRGLGHYINDTDGKLILHHGDGLVVEGEELPLQAFRGETEFFYPRRPAVSWTNDCSTHEEFQTIYLGLRDLHFNRAGAAANIIGWALAAPFAAALPYRPTLSINGESGTGKSDIMTHLIRAVAGNDYLLSLLGGSTEAGIRQILECDSLVIMLDEAESENKASQQRMQSVSEGHRSATSAEGGVIAKGTTTGVAKQYGRNSMMVKLGINPAPDSKADAMRELPYSLLKRDVTPASKIIYKKATRVVKTALKANTAAFFQATIRRDWAVLTKNLEVAVDTLSEILTNARGANLYGCTMAFFDLLHREAKPLTPEIVRQYAADWKLAETELQSGVEEGNPEAFMRHLLSIQVAVEGANRETHTIDVWLAMLEYPNSEHWHRLTGSEDSDNRIHPDICVLRVRERLNTLGIDYLTRLEANRADGKRCLLLRNESVGLKKALAGTPFDNWKYIAEQIKGIEGLGHRKHKRGANNKTINYRWVVPLSDEMPPNMAFGTEGNLPDATANSRFAPPIDTGNQQYFSRDQIARGVHNAGHSESDAPDLPTTDMSELLDA